MKGHIVISECHDPCKNLAAEEYLFNYVEKNNCLILYIWQNDKAVIIGRHQNAYTECNLSYAKSKNIKVIRRKSGGGAVYQDLGNINFTFITPKNFYDINRSTQIIIRALQKLNISVAANGRNDICLLPDGEKISGNAYRSKNNVGMHHGTILFDTNFDEMEKVLCVSPKKLAKRAISSVRSRVANILQYYPSLTIPTVQENIISEFAEEYNLKNLIPLEISSADFLPYIETYCNDDWNIGLFPNYEITVQTQFEWGNLTFGLTMKNNYPRALYIETDAPDIEDITLAEKKINEELAKDNSNLREIFYRNIFHCIKSQVMANDFIFLFNTIQLNET